MVAAKKITYRDEPTSVSKLGITQNKIVEFTGFVDLDTCSKIIKFFELNAELWGDVAFYNSSGMGINPSKETLASVELSENFFADLTNRFKLAVESVFEREVRPNTSHAQKWEVGGFATPHSDNSDFDGNPTSFEINKYVGILYLNSDYEGGTLYFTSQEDINTPVLEIAPSAGSYVVFPGGVENIHGVSEILSGTRYTMVSFWDFADAVYSEERQKEWQAELEIVEQEKEIAKQEWARGNKWA
jgi:hypothetical protein